MQNLLLVFSEIVRLDDIALSMKSIFTSSYPNPIDESSYILAKITSNQEDYIELTSLDLSEEVFEEWFNDDYQSVEKDARCLIAVTYKNQETVVDFVLKIMQTQQLLGIQFERHFLTAEDFKALDFSHKILSHL